MTDNIPVKPSDDSTRLDVATDEIDSVHYPIYKQAFGKDGEVYLIDVSRPMPVVTDSDLRESVDSLVVQLKILNAYMAEGFDQIITEEDTL